MGCCPAGQRPCEDGETRVWRFATLWWMACVISMSCKVLHTLNSILSFVHSSHKNPVHYEEICVLSPTVP